MKKLNIILLLLAVSFGVSAQGIFTNVWFNAGNWPTEEDPQEMADNPYDKKSVDAKKAGYTVDVEMLDEIGIADIWDRLGDEQFIDNLTDGTGGDSYDLDGDATFGGSFKTFWDDDMLYVVMKYVDVNGVADAGSRSFEIMYQTKDPDRYQEGFEAATTLAERNMQYSAFVELGAGKVKLESTGVTENVRNVGQEGAWGSALGVNGTYATNWNEDQDGTIWAVLGMSFDDVMIYMDDEWGAQEAANYVSLDPLVKEKIAFDVKTNSLVGGEKMEYFWSSDDNNGYNSNYWNGYLNFNAEEFFPVGNYDVKTSAKSAYIYDNILRFKGFETPVDVEIFSVVGQKVMSADNVSVLNVSELNNGIYLVKVAGEKKAFKVLK